MLELDLSGGAGEWLGVSVTLSVPIYYRYKGCGRSNAVGYRYAIIAGMSIP
jgi:hypothetical protein